MDPQSLKLNLIDLLILLYKTYLERCERREKGSMYSRTRVYPERKTQTRKETEK